MTDPRSQLSRADIGQFQELALALAGESRRMLRAVVTDGFEVKRKPDGSYVTSADLAVERSLRRMVQERFPAHGVIGEELPRHLPDSDFQWVFDPIDGTEEFVRRIPTFGTIIAMFYRDLPVVGVIDVPLLDDRVHAGFGLGTFRGDKRLRLDDIDASTPNRAVRLSMSSRMNFMHRRDHSAAFEAVTRTYPNHCVYRSCYNHLLAATGQADIAIDMSNPIWDIAAARILTEEAGGAFSVVDEFRYEGERIYSCVFGRPALVAQLAAVFTAAASGGVPANA